MNRVLKDYADLFALMRLALIPDTEMQDFSEKTPERWQLLYGMASVHHIVGMLYSGLKNLDSKYKQNLPEGLESRLEVAATRMAEIYDLHVRLIDYQSQIWKQEGIEAYVIKGLEASKYYPQPKLRVHGDIDWWIVRENDWDRALDIFRSKGCVTEADSDGDVHYCLKGVVIEHHRKGYQSDGVEAELQLQSRHVLHHAEVYGLELRQLYDYALARKATREVVDKEKYSALLASARITKWTAVLDSVADFLLEGKTPSRDALKLLDFVMNGSTFFGRTAYFLRIAPIRYMKRLHKLVGGRTKRAISRN